MEADTCLLQPTFVEAFLLSYSFISLFRITHFGRTLFGMKPAKKDVPVSSISIAQYEI